jgi:hypothetical protein
MQGQREWTQATQSSVAGGWWPAAGGRAIHMHPLSGASGASGAGRDDSSSRPRNRPRSSAVSHMHTPRRAEHGEMRAPGVQGMEHGWQWGRGANGANGCRSAVFASRMAEWLHRRSGPRSHWVRASWLASLARPDCLGQPLARPRVSWALRIDCWVRTAVVVCVRRLVLSRRQTCPVERAPRRTRSRGMPAADCGLRAAGCGLRADGPDCRMPGARPLSTFFFFTSRCHAMMRTRSRRHTRFAALRRVI